MSQHSRDETRENSSGKKKEIKVTLLSANSKRKIINHPGESSPSKEIKLRRGGLKRKVRCGEGA